MHSNDPWETFKSWFEEAKKTSLGDPNAMVLSTLDEKGNPDSRVVLCKEIRPTGLVFYTNYESHKGRQLTAHPVCAVNFFWDELRRQVKMQGDAKPLPRNESEKYWQSRARDSQLSQWVSKQSEPLASREQMEVELQKAAKKFEGKSVPCPDHWGGYLFIPNQIELWVGQKNRFHDRFHYTKVQNGWKLKRLYP